MLNKLNTFLLVLLGFAYYPLPTTSLGNCSGGPTYWCRNEENAKQCGVSFFCKGMKQSLFNEKIQFHARRKLTTKGKYDAAPVNVTLYYESLCPDCKQTWQYQLFPTFLKLKSSGILNIILVPYGNAREEPYVNPPTLWKFTCQHGNAECIGNLIETCAIYHYPQQNQHVPFIHCLEYYGPTLTNSKYCASLSSMSYDKIASCVNSPLGNSLEHKMALKTDALSPPHQFVPWFTMNGIHTDAIQHSLNTNMLRSVCNAYTGTKPTVCV